MLSSSLLSAKITIMDKLHQALPSLYPAKTSFDPLCADVRRDKFLIFDQSYGWRGCAGLSHLNLSLSCALTEASHMKRVLLVPDTLCISPMHNHGVSVQVSVILRQSFAYSFSITV